MSKPRTLQIDPRDDLVVALEDLPAGERILVGAKKVELRDPIPAKHKFSTRTLPKDDKATMYGVTVGVSTTEIPTGGLVHTGNLLHFADPTEATEQADYKWTSPDVSAYQDKTFDGYLRSDGKVGTANYWVVVPLVFCESRNLRIMRDSLLKTLGYAHRTPYERYAEDLLRGWNTNGAKGLESVSLKGAQVFAQPVFPNVDGVKFLDHASGCGGTHDDSRALCGLLAGYVNHPNVAGATVLSLGCQHAQTTMLEEELAARNPDFDKPLHIFEQQKCQSEQQMMETAIRDTFRGIATANDLRRTPASLDKLVLGVECGGSDGFSGISANPVIGATADRVVACGGAVLLSEFPELCGVERELADRCVSPELARRFLQLMEAYQQRAVAVGSGFEQNPSAGNVRDGLITDAMKSAGAAKKGGTSPITDVLDYPEPVTRPGLNLLCTPGNDVESTTAMAGSGANLMVFSTGLGTPTGNPVTPVIKVSTSADLARRLPDIIDFDAGPVVEGRSDPDTMGANLMDMCIETASGRYVPMAVRLGQDDFLPWKRGVSL